MPLPGVPLVPAHGLVRDRVRLRVATVGDAELVQELSRVPDVVRWTTYPADLDEQAARARIERGEQVADRAVFCVAELDGRPVGMCGASVGSPADVIEVFYAVLPKARRQGVARHALSLLVQGAREAGAHRVILETHLDNVVSQAVARSAGFIEVGRDRRLVKGTSTEVAVWQWQAMAGEPGSTGPSATSVQW